MDVETWGKAVVSEPAVPGRPLLDVLDHLFGL
jgi:hypothetical protein